MSETDEAKAPAWPLPGPKAVLHRYLRRSREALVWKLEGVSEYDARRPLIPSGTNLLGLVKHCASMEVDYFCETFGRESGIALPWLADDAEVNADMWVPAGEPRSAVLDLAHRCWAVADESIAALDLDAVGQVPWWPPEKATVTLHQILVHVLHDYARHAGHADILRELIDGRIGLVAGNENVPQEDAGWWVAYRARVEAAARAAGEQVARETAEQG